MDNISDEYKFLAFISYKREDEKWAKWLQHKLEHYKFPTEVRKAEPSLPERARPVFRDTTDLSGGKLEQAIKEALASSRYLIVVCSPRAAKSVWVCKEVQKFIDLGKEEYIIPFIIDGEPNADSIADECFPQSLRDLSGSREILGIHIDEMGREAAAIKVVARMFKIRFDVIWRRYERERKRRQGFITIFSSIFVLLSLTIGLYIFRMNIELERKLYQTQVNQSRAVVEKINNTIETLGVCRAADILLEVAPDIYNNQDWPYTFEVENALRKLWQTCRGCQPYVSDVLIGHLEAAQAVSYSPDGRFLASGGYDKTIRIWDLLKGQILTPPINSSYGYITELTWSPDGKYLVSGSFNGAVQLWDVASGELLNEYYSNEWGGEGISAISCSPDGKYVSFGHLVNFNLNEIKRSVYVWDISKNELKYEFKGHAGTIEAIAFSPDGRYIASSSREERCLRIWDTYCGKEVGVIPSKNGRMVSMAFLPDNKQIVDVTEDGYVGKWNIEACSLIAETKADYNGDVVCASFNEGVPMLFYADGKVMKYSSDIDKYQLLCDLNESLQELDFHIPNGQVACAENDGNIKIWNINTPSRVDEMLLEGNRYEQIEYHSDGELYAYALDNGVLKILDVVTGIWSIPDLDGKNAGIDSLYDTPDEDYKIARCSGRVIRLFDIFNDCEVASFVCPEDEMIWDIALSHDGNYIAVGCDGLIVKWNLSNGTYETVYDIGVEYVNVVCFTHDGSVVYGGGFSKAGNDTDNVFLHMLTKEGRKELTGHGSDVYSICLSDDGKFIATASWDDIILWDACSGMRIGNIMRASMVNSLCFSPDGRYLVSGSSASDHQTCSLCLWDVRQQRQLGCPLLVVDNDIYSVTFNLTGDEIAGGFCPNIYASQTDASSGLVRIPFASFDRITAEFHELLHNRELTTSELHEYFCDSEI